VVQRLGLDALDAQIRQVFFFDTPDLELNAQGLVVRARRVQGKSGDSVVKLRPVEPGTFPHELRGQAGFKVEVDAMPGGFVCSASLRGKADNAEIRNVGLGKEPLKGLFSKAQRALLTEHSPDGPALDDLSVFGPIFVLKLRSEPEGFGRRLDAELWLYPDESRVLELSTKCEPRDTFLAGAESRAFLSERGIDLEGEQEAKTAKALEFFAARAREDAPSDRRR
jgi:hypothetical protein